MSFVSFVSFVVRLFFLPKNVCCKTAYRWLAVQREDRDPEPGRMKSHPTKPRERLDRDGFFLAEAVISLHDCELLSTEIEQLERHHRAGERRILDRLLEARRLATSGKSSIRKTSGGRRSGVNYSEFARIRKPDLKRFTVDRLIGILNKLDQDVEVRVTVSPRPARERPHSGSAA